MNEADRAVIKEATNLSTRYKVKPTSYLVDHTLHPKRVRKVVRYVMFHKIMGLTGWFFGGRETYEEKGFTQKEVDAAVEVLKNLGYTVKSLSDNRYQIHFYK